MSKQYYFKITFLFVSVGVFVGTLVMGLFEVNFTDTRALLKLFVNSFVVGIVIGLLIGLINMYLKIWPFLNKK
ncbi:MAG: hypothetical protein ACOYMA_15850 [Bacteroidia bacterium]